MFCPKCGNQCPDGTQFCPKCGSNLSAPQQQQQQQYPNAGQQYQNTEQQYPNAGQQYQNMGQPAYGVPGYVQMQPKKSAAVPIAIICSVAVILIVFLILLFTVILPGQSNNSSDNPSNGSSQGQLNNSSNNSSNGSSQGQSVESRLKRRWTNEYGDILDLRNNTLESGGMVLNISWRLNGDDSILITYLENYETAEINFYLSSDGNELVIIENGDSETLTPVY